MLVRGGVEDGVRAIALEYLAEAPGVPQVSYERHKGDVGEAPQQLIVDLEHLILAVVEDQQLCGPELSDLPAEFGADGSSGSCDERDLSPDEFGHRGKVGGDRVAAEEVLDGHLAQRLDVNAAVDDIAHARDHFGRDAVGGGGVHHLSNEGSLGTRNGDDDVGRLIGLDRLAKVGDRAGDGEASQHLAVLGRVVVHKRDRMDARRQHGRVCEIAEDRLAEVPGADDNSAVLRSAVGDRSARGVPDCNARGHGHEGRQQRVEQQHCERKPDRGEAEPTDEDGAEEKGDHRRHGAREHETLELNERCVSPEEAVNAGTVCNADARRQCQRGVYRDGTREFRRPSERLHPERQCQKRQWRKQDLFCLS